MTRNHSAIVGAIQQFRGRKGDYTPMNDLEQRYIYYPAETIENIRNQVSLSAIKGFIIHSGGLKEGRKALILVSEGYSNVLPPQLLRSGGRPARLPQPERRKSECREFVERGSISIFPATGSRVLPSGRLRGCESVHNVAIYAVDPRGLAPFEHDIDAGRGGINAQTDAKMMSTTQNTLRGSAIETDGRAILNRNDLDVGMKQIMRDSSAHYLLGYTSAQASQTGSFMQSASA